MKRTASGLVGQCIAKRAGITRLASIGRSYSMSSSSRLVPQPFPAIRNRIVIRQNHTDTQQVSGKEYHQIADDTLESILVDLETLAESLYPKLDVELSHGVMTIELPPAGTYVINKQPPNKQIWLSSPISGPKRYDLVNYKWTNLRDGTTLGDLLRHEVSQVTNSKVKFADVDK